ncbi:MAG: HEAT repeat domain-containing protein [Gammaproteobacteria bacterium]|nr:HEAT repeat domain-containing protein [Gammaproteobacteria bacterium]
MFLDSAALPNYMVELIKDEKQPLYFRSDVAESLSELDSVGIVNYLVEQLNHPNRKIRSDATSILVRLGRIEAFKPLLEFLRDSDPNMRGKAASALGKSGNLEAVKPLIKLLRDSDSEVRSSAASALGELGSVKAVKPLIELLKDLKQNVRGAAVLALGELDTVEAIKPLIELRNDLDSNVRKNAASALGILDTIEVFTPLIELLSDPKAPVRSSAASALGELSIVGAEKSLIRLLGDNEKITSDEEDKSTVRDKATEALIALGSVGSVKPLLRQLKNKDSEVRDSAMEELRKFGIVPLDQLDEKVRFNELKKLKEKSAGKKSKERREAAKKLGEILSEASVQQLIKILGDTNRRVKTQAVKSLTRIARIQADLALPARPHLERLLEDPESRVREAAKRALDTLSHAAPGNVAAAKLKELALDKQERLAIRSSAIKLLGNLETEDSSEILITAFQQEEAEQGENELSFIVWQALGNLGSVDALPFLLEQLDELDRRKREWRKLRDQDSQNSDEPEDFSGDPQNFDEEDDTQPWYDGYLETELSYAIAKIDPTNEGLKLLHHNLANVRKGAWYGLAKEADAALVQRLVEDYQGLQHLGGLNPIFRHAVYRAMDKSLITVEVRGNTRDLDVLKILAKKLDKEGAVYDRTEWTIQQLEYRLKLEEEPA